MAQMQKGQQGKPKTSGPPGKPPPKPGPQVQRPEERVQDADIDAILEGDGERIVTVARRLASELQPVRHHQVRVLYGLFLKVEAALHNEPAQIASRLQLIRPKVHYMAARLSEQGQKYARPARMLQDTLDRLLKKAAERIARSEKARVEKLARPVFDFIEAVVAFHKGGER